MYFSFEKIYRRLFYKQQDIEKYENFVFVNEFSTDFIS